METPPDNLQLRTEDLEPLILSNDKVFAMRQTIVLFPGSPPPTPKYLWLGYNIMHKTQYCIGGGEGEVTAKTICGENNKCLKTSDQDCSWDSQFLVMSSLENVINLSQNPPFMSRVLFIPHKQH